MLVLVAELSMKKLLVSAWGEHQANWFLGNFVGLYWFQGQCYCHPLAQRFLEWLLVSPVLVLFCAFHPCSLDYPCLCQGQIRGFNLYCITLVQIHTVVLNMFLQFGQFTVDIVDLGAQCGRVCLLYAE